ncbi:MAG: tetratricopeptide repeat protein [Verrucomicrobiota bacterium]
MRLSRLEFIIIAVAITLVFVVFGRSLQTEFVAWDDDINIYKNEHIYGLTAENLKWMFTDLQQALRYKPLNWFTWAALYSLEGRLNPFNYHLANLLFHAANTLLVFLLLRHLLLRRTHAADGTRERSWVALASGLGTLFWALHPLRVEPVAWATGLPYGQSTMFTLASLLCYLKAQALANEPARKRKFYWLSVLAFALAVFTYPIVLAFPVVLVILDALVLRRFESGWWNASARGVWVEKLPFFGVTALIFLITLYGRMNASGLWTEAKTIEQFGIGSRTMQAFYIWAYYVWKPWYPTGLTPVYATLMQFNPSDAPFVASLALVVVLSAGLFIARRRWPGVWTVWLCHLVLLVPHLGLLEHPHYPSDRYGFIVGIVWAVLLAGAIMELRKHSRAQTVAAVALAGVVALFATLSRQQGAIWENRFTLYQQIVANLPDGLYRANVWFRYGVAHMQIKEYPQAISAYRQSLRIFPGDPMTHHNVAICYAESKRMDLAIKHFREAVRLQPEKAERHRNLAVALKLDGQVEEAKVHFTRAEELENGGKNLREGR